MSFKERLWMSNKWGFDVNLPQQVDKRQLKPQKKPIVLISQIHANYA